MASTKKRREFELQCTKQESCPSAPDDAQLIQRFKAGEREAFNELSRRYNQKAHGEAYRILRNDDDALEAVQKAFLNVYTHLHQFQNLSCFWPWLRRAVKHSALDIVRKESAGHRRESEAAAAHPTVETFTPLDALLAKDFQEWLNQHVEARTLLICKLLVEEELTYIDIADRMRTTVWTVRQAIIKLRKKLREYFADASAQSGERPLPRSR